MTHVSWRQPESIFGIAGYPDAQHRGGRQRPLAIIAQAIARFALWVERARQRRALATLDDRMLRDIGITRLDAARECGKPFWR